MKENSVVVMTFVMYDDGTFYMRDQSFDKHFILMSKMIKEYCSVSLHPYLPHIDEVCLGKFSGNNYNNTGNFTVKFKTKLFIYFQMVCGTE